MARPTSRWMSYADAAWLHMDRATNLMIITAVLRLEAAPDLEDVKGLIRHRLLARYPKFQQRIREEGALRGPRWDDDPYFELDAHLVRTRLPAPGDRAALERLVGRRMSEPLPHDRPLWQVELVEGVDQGAALVCRLHHCIADGISLMKVLLSLTDPTPKPAEPPAVPPAGRPPRRLPRVAADLVRAAVTAGRTDPWGALRTAGAWGLSAAELVLLPPDRRTVLKGRLGREKRAVWSEPVSLDRAKTIGHALGATLNDVMLASISGAVGRYLATRDSLVPNLRAIVPFNLRPLTAPVPADLGNDFGLVFVSLPVGEPDPLARLAKVHRRMLRIKRSPEGPVSYAILSATGCTPMATEKLIVDVFGSKVSSVMTNVPGPREPVWLAGRKVEQIVAWVPRSGSIPLGVSIFSYAGGLVVGFAADTQRIPDVDRLVPWFHEGLEALAERAGIPEEAGAEGVEAGVEEVGVGAGAGVEARPGPGDGARAATPAPEAPPGVPGRRAEGRRVILAQ